MEGLDVINNFIPIVLYFFLNYFCGANLKFQFTSTEDAAAQIAASPLLKSLDDAEIKNLVLVVQKLTSTQHTNSHLDLLQLILDFFCIEIGTVRVFPSCLVCNKMCER